MVADLILLKVLKLLLSTFYDFIFYGPSLR